MAKNKVVNTFEGGLVTDFPDYQTPNKVYTYSENVTFITHKGNEMMLQNEKGNVFITSLKENYIPLDCKSYGNIAYIVSAEVINGKFTGRGEIGSFPSPDYANAKIRNPNCLQCVYDTYLKYEYHPFMNYKGDDNTPLNPLSFNSEYGEFNSKHFNFKEDNPFKICAIQPSYDGSVNVIFTDWYNKPKLINSRFTVKPDDKVEIIDRRGEKDENLYDETNFDNKLNQIIISNKLISIDYKGYSSGKLASGNYVYYFKYYTQDGNLTNIIGESFTCSVFHGDTVSLTRGGIKNEPTNRGNKLHIKNLDSSFNQLKVYFTYSFGEASSDPEIKAFELESTYSYVGTDFEFTHTGYENTQPIDLNELRIDYSTVDTYRTCCEAQGRFFAANIKNKVYDYDSLRKFSTNIKIGYGTEKLHIVGLDTDNKHENIYKQINYSNKISDSYEAGYYNPYNVYYKLGYWGGETYMFGIQYYFNDGSLSPVFPIRGIDNKNGNSNYSTNILEEDKFIGQDYENIRGIYRFPQRNIVGFTDLNDAINIFVKFNIPIPPKEVLESTIGFRFVRARKRKNNVISQGILFNTMIIPLSEYSIPFSRAKNNLNSVAELGGKLWDYDNEGPGSLGFAEANTKFIPSFDFMMDSSSTYLTNKNGSRSNTESSTGLEMVRFVAKSFKGNKGWNYINANINKRFCFLSPDIITDSIKTSSKFDSSKKKLYVFGESKFIYAIPTKNEYSFREDKRGLFSLLKNFSVVNENLIIKDCNTFWILKDTPQAIGDGKFSSKCLFQASVSLGHNNNVDNNKYKKGYCYSYSSLIFNSYVGVKTDEDLIISLFDKEIEDADESGYVLNSTDKVNDIRPYDNFTDGRTLECPKSAFLVNIYPQEGLYSNEIFFPIHIPEYESYIPITNPYYWNIEIANKYEANTSQINLYEPEIKAFNGDNFLQLTHRRICFNGEDSLVEDGQLWRDINVGYSISFISESNSNIAAKNTEVVDITEGVRSFIPYYTNNNLKIDSQDTKGGGNKWREYRLPESESTNTGFNSIGSQKDYRALSDSIPFIQNTFDTRIIYSDLFVKSGFQNGYRRFQPLNKEDYQKNMGQIVEIVTYNGNFILVVFENGIAYLGLNERYGIQGEGTALPSAIFFDSINVLPRPEHIAIVSEIYGSKWQFSIRKSNGAVYGVDIDKAKIWRFASNSFELISDFKVQKFLREIKDIYYNRKENFLGHQIRTYFDVLKSNINFTFVYREICGEKLIKIPPKCPNIEFEDNSFIISGGSEEKEEMITVYCGRGKQLIFSESENKFLTFTNWCPQNMFTINDKLYSFDIEIATNRLYQHYVNPLYNIYYDRERAFVLEFVVTSSTQLHQIFENFFIIQNHIYPDFIEYWTENEYYKQKIVPRNNRDGYKTNPLNSLQNYDAVYKEDHMYITIIKDKSDNRTFNNYINKRIRDKFCKIRFTYNTVDKLQIQAIFTTIEQSFS